MSEYKQIILIKESDGEVRLSRSLVDEIENLPQGKYRIIIEEQEKKCSIPQIKLMWMWFTYLDYRTGTSKVIWHDHYKKKFLGDSVTSTKELTPQQLTHFMNHIQADVASEYGYTLPLPEDMFYNDFVRQYKYK